MQYLQQRAEEEDLAGNKTLAQSYLQQKCNRQAEALRILQRRIVNQRLIINKIKELGRELTNEEWQEAREAFPIERRDELVEVLIGY